MTVSGSTTERGYGGQHQRKRAYWQPLVEAGQVDCHADVCLMPVRAIAPDDEWDLGHNADRTEWTGPEHRRCNRSDGARRGNAMRTARQPSTQPMRTSRAW